MPGNRTPRHTRSAYAARAACLLLFLLAFDSAHARPLQFENEVAYALRAFADDASPTPAVGRVDAQSHGSDRWQQTLTVRTQFDAASDDDAWSLHGDLALRRDDLDDHRSAFDVRELYVSYASHPVQISVGARRVFWGVTEFVHLVDVINQVDVADNVDTEDRLGQPMLQVEVAAGSASLQGFLLPGLRERRFPGADGRLPGGIPLRGDSSLAPSLNGENLSFAVRGEWHGRGVDIGVAHFSGAGREPSFDIAPGSGGLPRLRPRYEHVEQTSIDAQWLSGDWAWKLEAYSSRGQGARYAAAAVGLERTFVGLFTEALPDSAWLARADLGVVLEFLYDQRNRRAPAGHYEHDVALGLRLAANDAADTSVLLGFIQDVHVDEHMLSVEGSTRLAPRIRLEVEARAFGGQSIQPALYALADPDNKTGFLDSDDYVQVELTAFF